MAVAEGGRIGAGPKAASVAGDRDHPAARCEHAPDFGQHFARMFGRLQHMDQQHPVDGPVGKRQLGAFDQSGGRGSAVRPMDGALLGRHEADDPDGLVSVGLEVGDGIAEARDREPTGVEPPGPDDPRYRAMRDASERRCVEGAKVDDIDRHALLSHGRTRGGTPQDSSGMASPRPQQPAFEAGGSPRGGLIETPSDGSKCGCETQTAV